MIGSAGGAWADQAPPDLEINRENLAYSILRVEGYRRQLMQENGDLDPLKEAYTWDAEKKGINNWSYFTGFVIDGLLEEEDEDAWMLAEKFFSAMIAADGSIPNYWEGSTDSVEAARVIFHFLKDPQKNETCGRALQYVFSQLRHQTSYPQCGGAFLILQDETGKPDPRAEAYQIFQDTFYMTQPFLMECAAAVEEGLLSLEDEDGVPIDPQTIRDEVTARYLWVRDNMYDNGTGLVQHGWNVERNEGNGHFWGRGAGWLSMSLLDVIELMPAGEDREALCDFLIRIMDGMLRWQDERTGLWFNVLTRDETLEKNRLETSVSDMMSYTLMKAYLSGIVSDPVYRDAGVRAFNGIAEYKLFGGEGSYFLQDTYLKSGVGDTDEYYVLMEYATDEGKGIGGLLFSLPCAKKIFMELCDE